MPATTPRKSGEQMSQAPIVLDPAAAAAFHSPSNISLGCRQVAPLFYPHTCRHFTADFFEQRHFHMRGGSGGDTQLHTILSAANLRSAATHWKFKVGVDHSQARLLLPDSFSHDEKYADESLLDGAVMRKALAANRTVVLHNMELYWPAVSRLCLALMRAFGVYAQANVYYAPSGLAKAVHAHQDAQSVFVVQTEGRKTWQLLEPPQRWRLRYNQRGKGGDVAPETELMSPIDEVTLHPGDVLFVPRGMYHRTSTYHGETARSPASLHVTIGVETDTDEFTWLAVLRDAAIALNLPEGKARLDRGLWEDERLRMALPLQLCRYGGSFERSEPLGQVWLARAKELLNVHLNAKPDSDTLRAALDEVLRKKQEYVERKRIQLTQFLAMGETAVFL